MKIPALVTGLLAAGLILGSLSAIAMLQDFRGWEPPHLTESNLNAGQVYHLFLAGQTWARVPAAPRGFAIYFDPLAAVIMLPLGLVLLALYLRGRLRAVVCGLALLLCATLPFAICQWELKDNQVLGQAGPWILTVLLSLIYAGVGCLGFCLADVLKADGSSRLPHSPGQTAAA